MSNVRVYTGGALSLGCEGDCEVDLDGDGDYEGSVALLDVSAGATVPVGGRSEVRRGSSQRRSRLAETALGTTIRRSLMRPLRRSEWMRRPPSTLLR